MLMFMKCSANVEAKHLGCYVPAFVELADEDDIGGEVRKIVDVGERPVLAILAGGARCRSLRSARWSRL